MKSAKLIVFEEVEKKFKNAKKLVRKSSTKKGWAPFNDAIWELQEQLDVLVVILEDEFLDEYYNEEKKNERS